MRTGREYLRVSKDRSGKLRSPAEQHAENVERATERGVDLGQPYREAAAVGASRYSKGTRDDFDRLLADLTGGQFGADELWLWESSRGSRKVPEWVDLIEACVAASVQIWVTTHGRLYNPANHRDRRTLLEDAVDSEYRAAELSVQVKRAARARAAAGKPHGKPLYGYRHEHSTVDGSFLRVVPDEPAASIVREVFQLFAEGAGVGSIATILTKRGVPTPGVSAVWRSSTVHNMLGNEGYLGRRASPRAGHPTIEGAWPPLVDEELWYRVKARRDDPGRVPRNDVTVKYLLSGIPFCGMPGCTGRMVYNPGVIPGRVKRYPNYLCADRRHNARKAGAWSPGSSEVNGLEDLVVKYVLALWDRDRRLGRAKRDPRIVEVERELRGLRARLDAFLAEAEKPDGPSPAAVARVERSLGPKIEACERQLAGFRAGAVLPDLGGRSLRAAWAGLSLAQQRTIINASVTIRVLPAAQGKRFDPALVDIKPKWI